MAKHTDESKAFAFLGVFLTIIGFIIVLLAKPKDKFAMYYAKQGLVLFIAWVIVSIIAIVPVIGWILGIVGWIILVVLWFMGWINALSGKTKPMPLLQSFADKFEF